MRNKIEIKTKLASKCTPKGLQSIRSGHPLELVSKSLSISKHTADKSIQIKRNYKCHIGNIHFYINSIISSSFFSVFEKYIAIYFFFVFIFFFISCFLFLIAIYFQLKNHESKDNRYNVSS